jgi:hypothetical protein
VGVFAKEEKVEHEVFGGLQAPSCEELNPSLEQGKPGAYSTDSLTSVSCLLKLHVIFCALCVGSC